MDRNKSDFSYEIADELGTLSTSPKGWTKEVNRISYNVRPGSISGNGHRAGKKWAGGSPSAKPKPRTCAKSCSSISRIGAEKEAKGVPQTQAVPPFVGSTSIWWVPPCWHLHLLPFPAKWYNKNTMWRPGRIPGPAG